MLEKILSTPPPNLQKLKVRNKKMYYTNPKVNKEFLSRGAYGEAWKLTITSNETEEKVAMKI